MFRNIREAINNYLGRNPQMKESLESIGGDIAIESLPNEYDNTPYCTIVHGVIVNTVGEYKSECAKHSQDYF